MYPTACLNLLKAGLNHKSFISSSTGDRRLTPANVGLITSSSSKSVYPHYIDNLFSFRFHISKKTVDHNTATKIQSALKTITVTLKLSLSYYLSPMYCNTNTKIPKNPVQNKNFEYSEIQVKQLLITFKT